jgi:hypothetical protein
MLLVTFYTRHLGHCLATTKSTFKQFVFKLNVNVRNLKAQWISQIFSAINIRCNNIHDCILNMSDLHYPSLSMFITTLNFPLYFSFLFMFVCCYIISIAWYQDSKFPSYRKCSSALLVTDLYKDQRYSEQSHLLSQLWNAKLIMRMINLELELPLYTRHIWFTLSIVIHVYHHFRL